MLVVQLIVYRGLMAWLIEWQFAKFDISFPIVTLVGLVLLLTGPITLVLLVRMWKARSNPRLKTPEAVLKRSLTMCRFLGLLAGVLALCAIVVALFALTIGGVRDKAIPVSLSSLREGTDTQGLVRIGGTLQLDRIGFFEDRLLHSGRYLWVAPVTGSGTGNAINLFVEIDERAAGPSERRDLQGVLRKAGVPGELRRLYENAGYKVDQPTYLLFKSVRSARAPYFGAGIDLLISSLVFLIFCAFLEQRTRRLRKLYEEGSEKKA